MNNTLGLILCFTYIFAMIGLAEGLRRWRGYGSSFTRKVIHIGVGMMSWFIPFLFTSPWPFVAACAAFMVINLLDWRYGFISAMQSSSRSNLGTVYFPLAAAAPRRMASMGGRSLSRPKRMAAVTASPVPVLSTMRVWDGGM